jgi:YHS domain-containing protein
MIRNLIFIFLILALYRIWKGITRVSTTKSIPRNDRLSQIDDEMVKDPNCQVYIPRSGAIRRRIGKQEHYFCSPDCAQEFEDRA